MSDTRPMRRDPMQAAVELATREGRWQKPAVCPKCSGGAIDECHEGDGTGMLYVYQTVTFRCVNCGWRGWPVEFPARDPGHRQARV